MPAAPGVMFGGSLKVTDIAVSAVVALILAFPSAILFSFAPVYSDTVLVPNMPLKQYRELSEDEAMEFNSVLAACGKSVVSRRLRIC